MDDREAFAEQRVASIEKLEQNSELKNYSHQFIKQSYELLYPYNFDWLGLPIIQAPQDIVAIQELIWKIKPDLVIETGIARGGSLMLSASILRIIGGPRKVLGIDIDIREHNRQAIESHPIADSIIMLEGSSVDEQTITKVHDIARDYSSILIFLDSLHTHDHVLKELNAYSDLIKKDSYIVVFDTFIEDMPQGYYSDRPWDVGNNPKTAVHSFLAENSRFEIDSSIESKLLITSAPHGYLKCIKD